ncbi:hypothetical protein ACP70R_014239 [Stipagrostis hirtigluma subsp. patula]
MGLPLEQWRGGEADGAGKEAPGCRTPGGGGQARASSDGGGAGRDCPAAPRKRRPAPGVVSQQRRDYYAGADVEAFFAAHNL